MLMTSSLPFGVGRGSDRGGNKAGCQVQLRLHCLSALVVVPTQPLAVDNWIPQDDVFIAFRRWSWFRPILILGTLFNWIVVFIAFRRWSWFRRALRVITNQKGRWSSLPFGVGRGSDKVRFQRVTVFAL